MSRRCLRFSCPHYFVSHLSWMWRGACVRSKCWSASCRGLTRRPLFRRSGCRSRRRLRKRNTCRRRPVSSRHSLSLVEPGAHLVASGVGKRVLVVCASLTSCSEFHRKSDRSKSSSSKPPKQGNHSNFGKNGSIGCECHPATGSPTAAPPPQRTFSAHHYRVPSFLAGTRVP